MVLSNEDDAESKFELLCPVKSDVPGAPDQTFLLRRPLSQFEECSWGVSPGNAVVVSSAMPQPERAAVQNFLSKAAELYGARTTNKARKAMNDTVAGTQGSSAFGNSIDFGVRDSQEEEEEKEEEAFSLFESLPRYGMVRNLLFSDSARGFRPIAPGEMSYKSFLGRTYGPALSPPVSAIDGVRKCPVGDMRLCVTSEAELAKCVRMRTALNAQLLEPKMSCKRAGNTMECMQLIRHGELFQEIVPLERLIPYRSRSANSGHAR